MKKTVKKIISLILVACLFCTTSTSVFAAADEEYLADLRIVYADSYEDAVDSLADGDFSDYKVLNENLNKGSGEQAVWLAYKTTTDIEEAITDIAAMQMNGGYNEGNYQEMIQQSFEAYTETSEVYLKAVEYFLKAYNAGDFMAESAFRQLNFYSDNVDNDGETLGNLFEAGLDAPELAKIFMQGNSYALTNIRSLLAMGVSYNEDGRHYLEHVADAAALFAEDPAVFEDEEDFEDYDGLAAIISATILTFRDMFEELAGVEDELNFTDEEVTDTEMAYIESYSFAVRLREVEYLDGQTLYDYCLNFELDEEDLSSMYPLVYALNDGQVAMTRVSHYYNVVRYSMPDMPEDIIEEQLAEVEEKYGENPFDVYTGVDMSVYEGTYALTSEAYRSDALTEDGFSGYLFEQTPVFTGISLGVGSIGAVGIIWAAIRTGKTPSASVGDKAVSNTLKYYQSMKDNLGDIPAGGYMPNGGTISSAGIVNAEGVRVYADTCDEWVNIALAKYFPGRDIPANTPFVEKLNMLDTAKVGFEDKYSLYQIRGNVDKALSSTTGNQQAAEQTAQNVAAAGSGIGKLTASLYIVGGAMMIYTAITLGISRYNYYHPDYDDIPVALVDLINTVDGDRYIKYDAVLEAEFQDDGTYAPGDTNAFEGERWNALYYTTSYEAGKPLLAEFVVSNDNNTPEEGYSPVHRFGEIVSYDLNKYCFESEAKTIYLSVRQSENNKSAVADVPEVVGSVVSEGMLFLAAGGGLLVGAGATIGVQFISKKKTGKKAAASTAGNNPEK